MAYSPLQTWLLAARPKTLPAAISPVIIGTALAYADDGFHLLSAIAAALGALLIQIGTNFANDYFDFQKGTDTSERLGPTRVTQAGLVAPSTVKRAMIIVFALAILVGGYLVWRGGWPIVVIGLLSVLFGVLYTGGPYPLGYHGWGDIFVLIFFGPVAVGGTYYVQTLDINYLVLFVGLAPGLLSVAILVVNNLRDLESDRMAGKRTLAVRFGRTFSIGQYSVCVLVAGHIPIMLAFSGRASWYVLISTVILFMAMPLFRRVRTGSGEALNDALAATGRLLFVFSLLFSIGWIL